MSVFNIHISAGEIVSVLQVIRGKNKEQLGFQMINDHNKHYEERVKIKCSDREKLKLAVIS